MGPLARDFKRRPWAQKAYIAAKFVSAPVGVVLVFVGAGDDHAVLVTGIVLLGVFAIETLLVFPVVRARHDLKRRQPSDSN